MVLSWASPSGVSPNREQPCVSSRCSDGWGGKPAGRLCGRSTLPKRLMSRCDAPDMTAAPHNVNDCVGLAVRWPRWGRRNAVLGLSSLLCARLAPLGGSLVDLSGITRSTATLQVFRRNSVIGNSLPRFAKSCGSRASLTKAWVTGWCGRSTFIRYLLIIDSARG